MFKNISLILCTALLYTAAVFAEPTFFRESKTNTASGVSIASLSVFTTAYDHSVDTLFWNDTQIPTAALYSGISNNFFNINGLGTIGSVYLSGRFYQKISNYGDWPQNRTNLYVDAFAGTQNGWSARGSYYDFCYTEGKGTIRPALEIGKTFDIADTGNTLRFSARAGYWQHYYKSNLVDLRQLDGCAKIAYGPSADNSIGLAYTFISSWEGTNNITNVDDVPVYHKFEFWYGHTWDILTNCRFGIRPTGYAIFNAIDPTQQTNLNVMFGTNKGTYNVIPDSGNFEGAFMVPLAVGFKPFTNNDVIECIVSIGFGLYYANFDHLYDNAPGGNNKKGWIPVSAIGLGLNLDVNQRCKIQIASQFIRTPEYDSSATTTDSDGDTYNYTYKENGSGGLTASSLGSAPLAISILLQL